MMYWITERICLLIAVFFIFIKRCIFVKIKNITVNKQILFIKDQIHDFLPKNTGISNKATLCEEQKLEDEVKNC